MMSLRALSISDVFFMFVVLLYSYMVENLWSFDYFLVLKEMTCVRACWSLMCLEPTRR